MIDTNFNIRSFALVALLLFGASPSFAELATVHHVVDGDTIKVTYQNKLESVRFLGVDTPECRDNVKLHRDIQKNGHTLNEEMALGRKAAQYTQSRVKKGDVVDLKFDVQKRDRYQRLLAYVYLKNGECLNVTLLKLGYAKPMIIKPNTHFPQ